MIAPLVEKLNEQYKNVKFVEVDVDKTQEVSKKYGVTSMYVVEAVFLLHFKVLTCCH